MNLKLFDLIYKLSKIHIFHVKKWYGNSQVIGTYIIWAYELYEHMKRKIQFHQQKKKGH